MIFRATEINFVSVRNSSLRFSKLALFFPSRKENMLWLAFVGIGYQYNSIKFENEKGNSNEIPRGSKLFRLCKKPENAKILK